MGPTAPFRPPLIAFVVADAIVGVPQRLSTGDAFGQDFQFFSTAGHVRRFFMRRFVAVFRLEIPNPQLDRVKHRVHHGPNLLFPQGNVVDQRNLHQTVAHVPHYLGKMGNGENLDDVSEAPVSSAGGKSQVFEKKMTSRGHRRVRGADATAERLTVRQDAT